MFIRNENTEKQQKGKYLILMLIRFNKLIIKSHHSHDFYVKSRCVVNLVHFYFLKLFVLC